ncbi:hypothetical protein [Nocardia sp. IFM 10818]
MNIGSAAPAAPAPHRFRPSRSRLHARLDEHFCTDLAHRPETHRELRQWRAEYAALADLHELAQLPDLVAADPNAVLAALLEAHHDGSALAAAALLHQMLPKLLRLTPYARIDEYCRDASYADRGGETIAAFLTVIGSYRPRPGHNVAAVMALQTLHAITASAGVAREIPLAPDDLTTAHTMGRNPLVIDDVVDWDSRPHLLSAQEVLTWAVTHGAITAGERQLLTAAYLSGVDDLRAVAAEAGLSYAALRQRLRRSIARVRTAVCTHLSIETEPEPGRYHRICQPPRRAA